MVELKRRHHKEITEDFSDRIWSLFGQGIHAVLERAETNAITEARMSIERQGWVISGQLDHYDPTTGILCDYKTCSVNGIRNGARSEWKQQLNILATILREHGHDVTGLRIVAILRDFSNSMAQRSQDYPECPVVTIDIPVWGQERAEEYIDERIRLHQAARDKLPECCAEDRWQTANVFALMKEGRKTAVKLFEDENEAETACKTSGDKHHLVFRPGKSIRCESYCPAAPFCEQYQREKASVVEE